MVSEQVVSGQARFRQGHARHRLVATTLGKRIQLSENHFGESSVGFVFYILARKNTAYRPKNQPDQLI